MCGIEHPVLTPRHENRQLNGCAHRHAVPCNVSSAFSFKSDAPDAVLHLDKDTPNRAQPCGPPIWPIDVSLILQYRGTMEWSLEWASVGGRVLRTVPRAMPPPRDVLHLKLRPSPVVPQSLCCQSLIYDARGP